MPIQQFISTPQVEPEKYGNHSNILMEIAAQNRQKKADEMKQKKDEMEMEKLKKENALLDFKSTPEYKNALMAEKEAEVAKKQTDAKLAGLDIYSKRLPLFRDTEDFSKGLPTVMEDLKFFGDDAKELLPRITYKKDLSGQKQIPDEEAFKREVARISDALGKLTGKTKVKTGDTIKWTEDVKDETTGKMKTVDRTLVYMPDNSWKDATATHGGIKDEAKAPEVKNFQVGDREIPHQWDDVNKEWTPIKGKGGPKLNPPEMTEPQAREKLFQLNKWRAAIARTGGVDEFIFALISQSQPEIAKKMQGADKKEALNFIKEQEDYYKGFLKSGKKTAPAPEATNSNVTHTYIPGKGLVQKGK